MFHVSAMCQIAKSPNHQMNKSVILPPNLEETIMFCNKCGAEMEAESAFCKNCGTPTAAAAAGATGPQTEPSPQAAALPVLKSKLAAGLLGIFLGCLGIHRFY